MKNFIKKYAVVIVAVITALAIGIALVVSLGTKGYGVKQIKTETTVELGQKFTFVATDFFDVSAEEAGKFIFHADSYDMSKVGEYNGKVTYNSAEYTIKVKVVDTTRPAIVFSNYYVITNTTEDLHMESFGKVIDACGGVLTKIDRYLKVADLSMLTDTDIKSLVDNMNENTNFNGYKDREAFVPTEEGIYTAIFSATDGSGNTNEAEVLIILDKTAPEFVLNTGDSAEITVEVDDITVVPDANLDKVTVSDNADGIIDINTTDVVMIDKGTVDNVREWTVTLIARDRAGNEGTLTYTILASKKEAVVDPDPEPTPGPEPTPDSEPTPEPEPEPEPTPEPEPVVPTYTYEEMNKTMWVTASVNVRDLPSSDGAKLGKLAADDEVTVTGKCKETGWYRIVYKGGVGYVSNKYLTSEEPKEEVPSTGTEDTGSEDTGNDDNTEDDTADEPTDNKEWVSKGVYEVNGYEIRLIDTTSREGYLWAKKLCEAGLYEPVWNEDTNSYYMLITADEGSSIMTRMSYSKQLRAYIEEKGGTPGNGSGSFSCIYIPGSERACYLISVEVIQ